MKSLKRITAVIILSIALFSCCKDDEITNPTVLTTVATDVYVARFESNSSGIPIAKYWKNGIVTPLINGSNYATINTMVVDVNDVRIKYIKRNYWN